MRRRVLFVCMGNICRSPTAEAVFRELVRREAAEHAIEADSAGTHAYHVGSAPDARTIAAARRFLDQVEDVFEAGRAAVIGIRHFAPLQCRRELEE